MRYVVCSVRDRASDAFGQPIFVVAVGQAIRSFSDEVNRREGNNALAAHPEDFDLYQLGVFDDNTGLFETETPRQVAIGKDLVR